MLFFLKKIILPPFSRLRKARINRQDRQQRGLL